MRRYPWLRLPIVALLLAVLALPAAVGAAPGGGNSAGAKACQDGGYANYARPDGTPFRNQGECVQYAAQGGTLRPPAAPLALTFAGWHARGFFVTVSGYTAGAVVCFQQVLAADAPYDPGNAAQCYSETPAPPMTTGLPLGPCYSPSQTVYLIARVEATGQEGRLQLPPCP